MIFVFLAIAIVMIIRTHLIFKKKNQMDVLEEEEAISEKDETEKAMEKSKKQVVKGIMLANQIYSVSIDSFLEEDRAQLKEALAMKDNLNKKAKKQKNKVLNTISKIEEDVDSGHFYVQMVDYQREMAHSLNFFVQPLYEHINNNHKPFIPVQAEELKILEEKIDAFFNFAIHLVRENRFSEIESLIQQRNHIMTILERMEVTQIKRIKAREVNTRNSVLFFNIITETKNMLLHAINLIKAHRDFIIATRKQKPTGIK